MTISDAMYPLKAGLYLRSLLMDRSAYAGLNPGTSLPLTESEKASAEDLVVAVHNNLAAVHLGQGKHERVIADCEKVCAMCDRCHGFEWC